MPKPQKTKAADRVPTLRQDKLVSLLLENVSGGNTIKSKRDILIKAGYSKTMATQPNRIIESPTVQKGLANFVDQLEKKRNSALKHLTEKKLERASARDTASVVDVLTKNHQLLSGNATNRIEITDEERLAVDLAFSDNTIHGEIIP